MMGTVHETHEMYEVVLIHSLLKRNLIDRYFWFTGNYNIYIYITYFPKKVSDRRPRYVMFVIERR